MRTRPSTGGNREEPPASSDTILLTMRYSRLIATLLAVIGLARFTPADEKGVNPQISKIVTEISEDRIQAIIARLVSFGTRNTLSDATDPERGVGAARQWILEQFQSYSPKLQVRFDRYRVKKQGQRIFKDVDLYNVIAVLPGKTMPETQVWISAHYDSLNLGAPRTPAAGDAGDNSNPLSTTQNMTPADFEKNAALPAPGACDDGSGMAAVMELARVMSQYEFDKTLVFVAFAGEEQGLIGSSLQAAKEHKANTAIEAVLNNDIIGTDTSGNGRTGNTSVSVYSDETADSPSQQLSRYAHEIAERYIPSMKVNPVLLGDRLGRGGDQTPFQWEGYAAVRLSTANEIYANQHHATDLLENMSVPYAKVCVRTQNALRLCAEGSIEGNPGPDPGEDQGRRSERKKASKSRSRKRHQKTLKKSQRGARPPFRGFFSFLDGRERSLDFFNVYVYNIHPS